ncbi:hypothetical protein DAPK24_044540 [Pichia kluyveri]|uniref:RGS domain-containing protein n=1 Tax=Pichia kluyveri TaxID=36015 RepID=A0AAV5R9A4_PICKL|nr:hypothetical protein DAPK24_044540 [Pichia kluyveri]
MKSLAVMTDGAPVDIINNNNINKNNIDININNIPISNNNNNDLNMNMNINTTMNTTVSNTPKLLDILNDNVDPDSTHSKINFLEFLVKKHCIENYEFFSELSSIISNYDTFKKYNSTAEWFSLYYNFIESEIINLPATLISNLSKKKLPELSYLKNIEKIILNYLLATYYEFLTFTKSNTNSNSNSAINSNTNSNVNSRSTSFSNSVSTSFPTSTNEQITMLTVNKLNYDIRHKLLLNNNNNNSQFGIDSDDDNDDDYYDDDHKLIKSYREEEDKEDNIQLYDDDDDDENGIQIGKGKDINKIISETTNRSMSASLSNSILKSRSPSPISLNNNNNNFVGKLANSSNNNNNNNNNSNNNTVITDSNSIISNSSSSNSTVCESCDCDKELKKWSKFTKKLKWRRKSSTSTSTSTN